MNVTSVVDKFRKMGSDIKINIDERVNGFRRSVLVGRTRMPSQRDYVFDLNRNKNSSEKFQLRVNSTNVPTIEVLDVQPDDRHLLLLIKSGSDRDKIIDRYLCGHDERDWFIASVPGNATNVRQAKDALKPPLVREAELSSGVRSKKIHKHRNEARVRQGEWFFVPAPGINPDPKLILKNEPLQRGRSKPHLAQELYREGGTAVFISAKHPEYPNGLTGPQLQQLIRKNREVRNDNWQERRRNPAAYVRGRITHPDHATRVLNGWHRVVSNTEDQTTVGSALAFLD
jgi:hypothetical protein